MDFFEDDCFFGDGDDDDEGFGDGDDDEGFVDDDDVDDEFLDDDEPWMIPHCWYRGYSTLTFAQLEDSEYI